MDRGATCKPSGSVGLVALELLRRVFGVGRSRRSRYNFGEVSRIEGYSRLPDTDFNCESWKPIENWKGRYDCTDDDEDEEVELRALMRSSQLLWQRQRSSFSSNDSSRRSTLTDQYYHRRRKGFYCMRLRIVNVARLVAMMRKVRVAYRRMLNAAAASKTILSLADLYNDIADLIPVPGSSSKVGTIVVIRPIKCAPGADGAEERPAVHGGHGSSLKSSSTTSSLTCEDDTARRPASGHDVKSSWSPSAVVANHKTSSCRKFAFPSFSRAFSMNSCTWASTTDDP